MDNMYGYCPYCGTELLAVRFVEEETKVINGIMCYTGRTRYAVSHLECPLCLKIQAVDDTYDGPWR